MKRKKKKRLARPEVSWPGAGGEEGGRGATLCLPPSAKKEVPPHPKVGARRRQSVSPPTPRDEDLK